MEPPSNEAPKLSNMVMCGDHPSFTTDLNLKDAKTEDKEKQIDKPVISYAKITPSMSRTEALLQSRARVVSEHVLPAHDLRRRGRPLEQEQHDTALANNNRHIAQAAFPWAAAGSYRWPPYLLAVWFLVLVLTHILHCLVNVLDRALPALRRCTQYMKAWTEEMWQIEAVINHHKLYPIALASLTGVLYVLYFALYAIHVVAVWSIEPLNADVETNRSRIDMEAKVLNYDDEVNNKTNSIVKQQ